VPHKQGVEFGELLRTAAIAALNHPKIGRILTAGERRRTKGKCFFNVME